MSLPLSFSLLLFLLLSADAISLFVLRQFVLLSLFYFRLLKFKELYRVTFGFPSRRKKTFYENFSQILDFSNDDGWFSLAFPFAISEPFPVSVPLSASEPREDGGESSSENKQ